MPDFPWPESVENDPRFDERGYATEVALAEHVRQVRAFVEEQFEERAAIFEYENNWPRKAAEWAAHYWSIYGRMPPQAAVKAAVAGWPDSAEVPD